MITRTTNAKTFPINLIPKISSLIFKEKIVFVNKTKALKTSKNMPIKEQTLVGFVYVLFLDVFLTLQNIKTAGNYDLYDSYIFT